MPTEKSKEAEKIYFKILGPIPIGTRVKVYDKRFKKGSYVGIIRGYWPWMGDYYGETRDTTKLRYPRFSYILGCKAPNWVRYCMKTSARRKIEVLNK